MKVQRFDVTGKIRKVVRTPQGGIRVEASLTRTGVFDYLNPDGSIRREMRTDAEVFNPDSLASLSGAPVTDKHPKQMVTPETWGQSAVVGHVATEARRDGDLVVADLVIQGGDVIKEIEQEKKREISCGYRCTVRMQPGENYDAVQTGIIYNHVALVEKGRAGSRVALRIDAHGDQLQSDQQPMKIEIINGTEYEVGTPAHTKAKQEQTAAQAKLDEKLERLDAENTELREAAKKDEEAFAKRVNERVAVIALASRFDVAIKDDETDDAIRVKVLTKLSPSVSGNPRLEDPIYVQARLDAALEMQETRTDVKDAQTKIVSKTKDVETETEEPADVKARREMLERLDARSQPKNRTTMVVRK